MGNVGNAPEERQPRGDDPVFGFLDAFFTAIPLPINGKMYQVAPLGNDDYVEWIKEMTAQIKESRQKIIPPTASAAERWKITANINETEITPNEMIPYIWRVDWMEKICNKALKNAEVPDEDAKKFLKMPVKMKEMLTAHLSGLFTKTRLENLFRFDMTGSNDLPQKSGPATLGGQRPLTVPGVEGSASDSSDDSGEK